MKQVSEEFKQKIISYGREQDALIIFGNTTITSDDLNGIFLYYEGRLLKSVMKGLNLDCNIEIPKGTEFVLKYGLNVNGEYEYITLGTFIVRNSEYQEDTYSYSVECYDKLLYSMVEYKAMNVTYPITVRDYITKICEQIGLEFKNKENVFPNYNKIIHNELYLNLDYTYRDVLDELAQVTAGVICIDEQTGQVEIRNIKETNQEINEDYFNEVNVKFGEKFGPINSIVLSRADADNIYIFNDDSIAKNGLTEVKIIDNQIMNFDDRNEYLPDLLEALDGIEYYLNDFSSTGLMYFDLLDRYTIRIGDNIYSCVMFNEQINIEQGLEEIVYTERPEESETDYEKADKLDRKINKTIFMVDKQNQKIESIVSEIGDRSEKTTSITQDLEKIEEYVKNNIDITRESTGIKKLELENSMNGTLLSLHIYGNNTVFASLLPNDNLLPSDDLLPYGEESLIKVTRQELDDEGKITSEESEIIDLGVKLALKQKDGVYDEYVLENGKAKVIRRIGVLNDQTTFIRETPIIEDLGTLEIKTARGNTIIEILNYTANMMADYVIINDYTEIFATTVDVMASISILEQRIMLEVNKKVNDETIIASINLAVKGKQGIIELLGNVVKIESDNFKLTETGKIICTAGEIGGWDINSSSLLKEKEQSIQYVRGDIQECELLADLEEDKIWSSKYIGSLNADAYRKFDFDGDGEITHSDLNTLIDLVGATERPISTIGKTQINSNDIFNTMTFENDTMSAKTKIGSLGIDSNIVGFKLIFADRLFLSKGIILPIGDGLRQVIPVVSYTNNHNYQFDIENINDLNFLRTFVDVSDMGHIPIIPENYKGIQTPITNNKINILTDKGTYMEVQNGTNTYIVQYATSDKRLKKNIKETEIKSALDLLSKIEYYSFDFKSNDRHQKIGFEANKLHELDENLTIEVEQPNGEIIYNYDINTIIPLFGKGLKEANDEIRILKKQMEDLKRQIEELKKGSM